MAARKDLPDETVRRIRTEAKHWPLRVLEKRFGLTNQAISKIVNRASYGHVV